MLTGENISVLAYNNTTTTHFDPVMDCPAGGFFLLANSPVDAWDFTLGIFSFVFPLNTRPKSTLDEDVSIGKRNKTCQK